MKNANGPRAASPQAPGRAARKAGRPSGSSPKGVVPLGLGALGWEGKRRGHTFRRSHARGQPSAGRPAEWQVRASGGPSGDPCDSVALGMGNRRNPGHSSHTKQMLHDQRPSASPASLPKSACPTGSSCTMDETSHAKPMHSRTLEEASLRPGPAHEGQVVLKTGHLCYIRH